MRWRDSNILSGVLFVAIGLAFLVGGLGLPAGTAQRMGPGWFPVAVSLCLMAMGAVIAIRGALAANGDMALFVWRPLFVIAASLAVFIVCLDRLGLALAVTLAVIVSAYAHPPVHLPRVTVYALALGVFCSVVFVRLLGLQLPIIGDWLSPWLGRWS